MAAVLLEAAGICPASLLKQLAPGKPRSDDKATHVQLRIPVPAGLMAEDAAATVFKALKPEPEWVAARCKEHLEFIAVWGGEQQPRRQKLKQELAGWLVVEQAAVKDAFAAAGLRAWRFDAIASLRRLRNESSAPDRPAELDFSSAGWLTSQRVNELQQELSGSGSEREREAAERAEDLMRRHVYGTEDLSTRLLADRAFLADHLRRKGPETFVKDMKQRVREAELQDQTLVSLCAAAAGGAEPYSSAASLNGSGWQLDICAGLASPPPQIRGVMVLGPPRCGKSHVGHQLYKALPPGAVLKVQEAEHADIYTFGTQLGPGTVLLQIDEFEGKTPLAKMKNLLEPHNEGFEVRTGSSKSGTTHSSLPKDLRVLITSNWTKAELVRAYKGAGATDHDLDALWERVLLIDLFESSVVKRPREHREDLPPARVAATLVAMAAAPSLPFPRQTAPTSTSVVLPSGNSPPPRSFSPQPSPLPKRRRLSAPGKLLGTDFRLVQRE